MKRPIKSIVIGFGKDAIDISNYVSAFEYTRSIKKADNLEITIEGGDAEWVMEHKFMRSGMPITFQYGFAETGMCEPIVLNIGIIEPEYEPTFSAVISSADPTVAMNKVYSNITWKNKTIPQIVKTIAEMHQINCMIQVENKINKSLADNVAKDYVQSGSGYYSGLMSAYETNRKTVELNKNAVGTEKQPVFQSAPIPITFNIFQSIPQAGLSNKSFLDRLCRLTPGFITYYNKGTLVYARKQTNGESVGTVSRGDDTLKKLSFEYTDLKSLPQEIKVDETKIVNKDLLYQSTVALGDYTFTQIAGSVWRINPNNTATPVRSDSDIQVAIDQLPKNTTALSLNLPVPDPKITVNDIQNLLINGTTLYRASDQLESEIVATALSILSDSSLDVLTLTVEEEGNLKRDINTVITIKNVASRYTGNYLIYEVVDTFNDAGFFTTITGYKDAGVEGEKKTESANNSQPNDTGGYEVFRFPLHVEGHTPIQAQNQSQVQNDNNLEQTPAPKQGVEIGTNGLIGN